MAQPGLLELDIPQQAAPAMTASPVILVMALAEAGRSAANGARR
ncbi:MAG: hypothetical protein Q8R49_02100 [Rhodoferax sp.]|nr:hypothetical protein [Rhodoferax sp.]